MKVLLFILSLFVCTCALAQAVPISALPTQATPPKAMWLAGVVDGQTRKIDVKTLPKLDSFYMRGDTLWGTKAGRTFYSIVSAGTGNGGFTYEDPFTGASNSFNTSHPPIAGTVKVFINGVKLPQESYAVSSNNVLINTANLSFTLSINDRVDINYQSTF